MADFRFTILQEFGIKKALGLAGPLQGAPVQNRAEYIRRVDYWEDLVRLGAAERIEEGRGRVVYGVKYEAALQVVYVGMNEEKFNQLNGRMFVR